MDKQEAIKRLEELRDCGGDLRRLNDVIAWLHTTETVKEVQASLRKLIERTKHMHVMCMFPDGSGRVADTSKNSLPHDFHPFDPGEHKSLAIDKISQEPSSEPPDPSEIEPGEMVPTYSDLWVPIYPNEHNYIVMMPSGSGWQPVTVYNEHINWQEWRRHKSD